MNCGTRDGFGCPTVVTQRLTLRSGGSRFCARGEAVLRSAVYETYLLGDNTILITEGESSSWLLGRLVFIVDQELNHDPAAREACPSAKGPFAARGSSTQELAATDSGAIVTFVSRLHKELPPSRCTVDEIDQLAKVLEDSCRNVHVWIAAATKARI